MFDEELKRLQGYALNYDKAAQAKRDQVDQLLDEIAKLEKDERECNAMILAIKEAKIKGLSND